jgi:CelD/BcsL family acetyltransferase involved in cellulose biosynthesis
MSIEFAADVSTDRALTPEAESFGPELADGTRFDVEVVTSVDALDRIAPEWHALEALSPATCVFQSFAQIRLWAHHFVGDGRGAALHVAVVRRNGRPVLILPTIVSGSSLLRIARIAGDPIAQYSDLLLDPSLASRAAFDTALASLGEAGVDAIVLRRVRDDSHLLRFAAPYLRPATGRTVAPFADLSNFTDFAAFKESLSRKTRHSLRNRRNHLEEAGDFRFEIFSGGPEARAVVADAVDLKRKWLVQRGSLSSAFIDPATKACLLDLAESKDSGAVTTRLVIGGEAAAIRFGFEYRGTHFAYMSAYDARFSHVSPGKLLMEFVISGFRERGFERIDMLPPAGRHKSDWCKLEASAADYTLPLSRTGRAYAEIYRERVRPGLKRAFEKMPPALRSLAAVLFVRV